MEFDWNGTKYCNVLTERGFGFGYANRILSEPHKVIGYDYKEDRFRVNGMIEDRAYLVST